MRKIEVFETSDGSIHRTKREADRHAEKRYGDLLLSLGRQLTHQNYTFVTDFIHENIDAFVSLKALKEDHLLLQENFYEVHED